jgi:hypothetical protein
VLPSQASVFHEQALCQSAFERIRALPNPKSHSRCALSALVRSQRIGKTKEKRKEQKGKARRGIGSRAEPFSLTRRGRSDQSVFR